MPFLLWTLASLIAYAVGLIMVARIAPMLLVRKFDEGLFLGIAALVLLGGMLAFGGVAIPLIIFNRGLAASILAFFMLVGIIALSSRMSYLSFRPAVIAKTVRSSRIITGTFFILLILGAIYNLTLLFRS